MRKKIIAANWKMNLTYAEAMSLTDVLVDCMRDSSDCSIIIGAPFIYLHDLVSRIQSQPFFSIAAQNCSEKEKGAYTGEIAAFMLSSIGVEHVILGHSERRKFFSEDNDLIAAKVKKSFEHGLMPVFCCGEELSQRKSGNHFTIVEEQLTKGLFHLDESQMMECIIAYEPVWAIGTGVNASVIEAKEMHQFIREKIADKYGRQVASSVPVIYGGSVNRTNASELFGCDDIDGALVGGASLKSFDFLSIITEMNSRINSNA
jgi:triosephosphate isomerase